MISVFLGGTCNESVWRDALQANLNPNVNAFNPVVPDWTPECQAREIEARKSSDYVLYVITPKMTGVYSIAEVIDDSNKRPYATLFAYLLKDGEAEFTAGQIKSLAQVAKMVDANGGKVFFSLNEIAVFLNNVGANV